MPNPGNPYQVGISGSYGGLNLGDEAILHSIIRQLRNTLPEDVIARGASPVDIHNPAGKGTVLKRLPPGDSYDIPLRCLIPQGVENLLVAGRCLSGKHEAHRPIE